MVFFNKAFNQQISLLLPTYTIFWQSSSLKIVNLTIFGVYLLWSNCFLYFSFGYRLKINISK